MNDVKILHGPYGKAWAYKVEGMQYPFGWRRADNEEVAIADAREEVGKWPQTRDLDVAKVPVDRLTEAPRRQPETGPDTDGNYVEEAGGFVTVNVPFGGACPIQGEGVIDGHPCYYRSRGSGWSLDIDLGGGENWCFSLNPYAWPDAGWIAPAESQRNIAEAVKAFRGRFDGKA